MKTQTIEARALSELATSSVKSVADLPGFPYATYSEFVEASANERVLVGTRADFKTFWGIGPFAQRFWLGAHIGIAPLLSFGLVLIGISWHNFWFLLAIPCTLIGMLFASPNLGCLSGLYPTLICGVSLIVTLITGKPYIFIGVAGIVSWFATSAVLGIADLSTRKTMFESEPIFLWLWARGYVADVVKKDVSEDKSVWPPPPTEARKSVP